MADTITSIALITKYSTEGFDKVYKHDAISSVLSKESTFVKFTGNKTVKIANIAFGGLSDYTRNNLGDPRVDGTNVGYGYKGAPASLRWEERTIRMDRAAKYVIEKFDDEESGGLLIGNALTEINRTQIVPEVDAYCFSEIYKNAGHVETGNYKITRNGTQILAPLAALNAALTYEGKHEVPDEKIVIFCSYDYLNALRNTEELVKFMQQGDYDKDVSFRMTSYEGKRLIACPPARFKTDWNFGDLGYSEKSGSADIDFIVMPLDAAVHVVKFQKTRVLEGDVATAMSNMDGYVLLARIYHDVFVLDNKKVAIYAHTGWFNDASSNADVLNKKVDNVAGYTAPLLAVYAADGVAKSIVAVPGDKYLSYVKVDKDTAVTLGTSKLGDANLTVSDALPIGIGDAIDDDEYSYYGVDANGVFVAKATVVSL